jgi:FtsP/CotA-like multicopper oxidase with cupredoxin domain
VTGQTPEPYDANNPPANYHPNWQPRRLDDLKHDRRPHAFHIHQLHFLVTAIKRVAVPNPQLVDTVTVPFWKSTGPYPKVTVPMDFRDPNIAGSFVYYCHIPDHEEARMMATIKVNP